MLVEACPVNKSIQEINDDSWVIGNRILLSRRRSPSSGSRWSDGTGSFYVISDAPYPLPPSRPLPATTNIQMIYDAGGVSAVWSIGDTFCKVKILDPGATREHVTLEYLHDKRPLSFATPDVHYHAEYDGRYYIILSRLTGGIVTLSAGLFGMVAAISDSGYLGLTLCGGGGPLLCLCLKDAPLDTATGNWCIVVQSKVPSTDENSSKPDIIQGYAVH